MQWNSAAEFFAMGGYGVYVWGSFGVTALALVVPGRSWSFTQVPVRTKSRSNCAVKWSR